jgi:hypothetical protein
MSVPPLLNAAGRRRSPPPCPAISPGAGRATRDCATRPIRARMATVSSSQLYETPKPTLTVLLLVEAVAQTVGPILSAALVVAPLVMCPPCVTV